MNIPNEMLSTSNEFTRELIRSKVLEEYKKTCLTYYTYKGIIPNSIQRGEVLKRLCKEYDINYNRLEFDIINSKLSKMEMFNFSLKTFDMDTIINHDKYLKDDTTGFRI